MLFLLCCLTLGFNGALCARDILTTLQRNGHYNQMVSFLNQTGLMSQLLAADNITIFLPTDEALNGLPATELADLKADPQRLKSVLEYHVVIGKVQRTRGNQDVVLNSISNLPIRINVYKDVSKFSAEGVEIVWKDGKLSNGVIQGLNGIMTPPAGDIVDILSSRPDMTNLTSLLTSSGLINLIKADQNMTVFAPTDAAFSNLDDDVMDWLGKHPAALKEVLLYHTVTQKTLYKLGMRHSMTFQSGNGKRDIILLIEDFNGNVFVDRARVSEVDISATNGVIHVIDDVMIPTGVVLLLKHEGVNLG